MNCSYNSVAELKFRQTPWLLWLGIVLLTLWSLWRLQDAPEMSFSLGRVLDFFSYALRPALSYQAASVPEGLPPLLLRVAQAAGTTVLFAAAGVGLSLLIGIPMAFFSSIRFTFGVYARTRKAGIVIALPYMLVRIVSTLMRSIHELLWAVLFLAAFGLSEITAVVAIAIPYAGEFARVFSDLIDETPNDAANALEQIGAKPWATFLFGILPVAIPNLAAYTLYRFECALRSSAILGFFGIPTLGYFIATSFENLYYAEVWTYLWGLFLLVALLDGASEYLRRSTAL